MSWIELVQNDFILTTGDSKEYRPNWIISGWTKDYNHTLFDFPEVKGTLVKRKKPKGKAYNLEIIFQGEDNIDTAKEFDKSADDDRPWKIQHPLYGTLIVQPLSIGLDNSSPNVSKFICSIMETIAEENPRTSFDPADQVSLLKSMNDENLVLAFTEIPSSTDVTAMANQNNINFSKGVPIIKLPEEFETYINLFNEASNAIDTATASPLLAMRAAIAMITAPAKFTADVETRLKLLMSQFDTLRSNITGLSAVSSKQIYQTQCAALISSLCLTATTPLPANYTNNTSVLNVIDTLTSAYDIFLLDLDTLQGPNGGDPNSFIPDAEALIGLNNLFNLTVANLFTIALESRKERFIITESDTNLILLTHRLYSLDPDDKNMQELMDNNGFGLNHILQIKKGTKVVYYI